jgi:cytochrome c oxidase subunit I+III
VLARSWSGRLRTDARATIDNTQPLWHGASAQTAIGALAVQWMSLLAT